MNISIISNPIIDEIKQSTEDYDPVVEIKFRPPDYYKPTELTSINFPTGPLNISKPEDVLKRMKKKYVEPEPEIIKKEEDEKFNVDELDEILAAKAKRAHPVWGYL